MEDARSPHPRRYIAHALVATLSVILLPAAAVTALEMRGHLESGALALALGAALSILIAAVGARLWARRPGSRDIVFSDLMLWGFIRRLRTERRLAEAHGILGLSRHGALESDIAGSRAAEMLEQLGAALEARDAYTYGHAKRVARHSHMIATAMGLAEEHVAKVRTAAAIHDVGKARTPRSVLNKPGKLNAVQQQLMNRHAIDGAKMAESIGDPEITVMVRHHHERLDGRGYPDGLQGEDIPLGARIIAVADTFDAMTSARAYRSAMRHSRALKILRREAGTQLDPAVVTTFTEYYAGQRSVAWWAIWTTAPQRVAAWIGSLLHTTSAASLSQSVAAIGTAAALAGGAAETARHHERDAHRAAGGAAAYSAPAYHPSAGAELTEEEVPEPLTVPVSAAPEDGDSRPRSDGGGTAGRDGVARHPGETEAPPKYKAPKNEPAESKPEKDQGGGPKSPKKDTDPIEDVVAKPGKGSDKPRNPNAKPKPAPEPVEEPAPAPEPPNNGKGPKKQAEPQG